MPMAKSLQAPKPIRISLPSSMGPGWNTSSSDLEEQDEDTQEPSSSQQKQAKLWPTNLCLTAVMSTGTSPLQPCWPWSSKYRCWAANQDGGLGYSSNNPYCKHGLGCKTHSNMREEALWAGHSGAKEQRHPNSPLPFVDPPGVPSATMNETGQVSDWHPAGDKEQKLLPTPEADRAQPCSSSQEG